MTDRPVWAEVTAGNDRILPVLRFCEVPKALLALGICISVIEVAATLSFPLMVRRLIDHFDSENFTLSSLLLDPLVITLVGVLVIGAVAGGLSSYAMSLAGHKVARSLKQALFDAIIARNIAFFDKSEVGALVSRMSNDTRAIVALLSQGLAGLFSAILLLFASMLVLFSLDATLAGVIMLIILITTILISPIVATLAGISRKANDRQAQLGSLLTRTFRQVRLVKAFDAERQESQHVKANLSDVFEQNRRASLVKSTLQPITGLALSSAFLSIMIYGGARVENGSLSVGTLTAFILYIVNLVAPLVQFSTFLSQYQEAKASASRLTPLLEEGIADGKEFHTRSAIKADDGDLTFEGVRFSYAGEADEPALDIADLRISRGRALIVTGRNGSGKSTLLSLLLRFYEPQQGAIRLGPTNIATLPKSEWRSKIGYMAQQTLISSGSIAENVAYGAKASIDEDRVLGALVQAGCDDFIGAGKLGIHDRVGEAGRTLSGGQAQRIGLARIIYRNPDIVLLDEPTASLDPTSEKEICKTINTLINQRIVIIISHRPLDLDPAKTDIIAIEHGRLLQHQPV